MTCLIISSADILQFAIFFATTRQTGTPNLCCSILNPHLSLLWPRLGKKSGNMYTSLSTFFKVLTYLVRTVCQFSDYIQILKSCQISEHWMNWVLKCFIYTNRCIPQPLPQIAGADYARLSPKWTRFLECKLSNIICDIDDSNYIASTEKTHPRCRCAVETPLH